MSEEDIIPAVWAVFKSVVDVHDYRLFLFGSRATKKNAPHADFDFCILGSKPLKEHKLTRLKHEIDELKTLFSIDIVDLGRADHEFREVVEKEMIEVVDGQIRSK